eukprot:c563_g1_i2.p1 GENE.c563_g1_i2~~c563_g1_i2.p1  ORF type:complete len:136 (+),score=35.77 c563_g1_i2:594-1001(+)
MSDSQTGDLFRVARKIEVKVLEQQKLQPQPKRSQTQRKPTQAIDTARSDLTIRDQYLNPYLCQVDVVLGQLDSVLDSVLASVQGQCAPSVQGIDSLIRRLGDAQAKANTIKESMLHQQPKNYHSLGARTHYFGKS